MKNKIHIAPSILSADLLQLQKQIEAVEKNGADFIHVDVMDGHFVPNLTFGPIMVSALKRIAKLPLDVHLMITNADQYIETYAEAGADILTVHQEACTHLHRTVQKIHNAGIKAGVSLNPATPLVTLENIITDIDLILIMSVNPGFGGQKFIPQSLKKIETARKMIEQTGKNILLEVDGGVNKANISQIVNSGADVIVAGNAIFGTTDIKKAIRELIENSSK